MKGAGVQVELRKARSMIKKGRTGDAMALLRSVLQMYPSNKPALKELAELEQRASASEQTRLRNHYSSGRLEQALGGAKELSDQYPSVLFLGNFGRGRSSVEPIRSCRGCTKTRTANKPQ